MKAKILLTLAMTLVGSLSFAQTKVVLISERTAKLRVDISKTNVKWSRIDFHNPYTTRVVKVLVPDLADVTILDHRDTVEGAPCLASYQASYPMEVVQSNPDVEVVPMTITLHKILTPDPTKGLCQVALKESIVGEIRGFKFENSRMQDIGEREIDDCR